MFKHRIFVVVPFNEQNAIVQALFCCTIKQCTMQMPPRILLKPVTLIVANTDVEATKKEKVLRDFDLN